MTVLVQTQCFDGGPDGAGLSAVLVDDYFRLMLATMEVGADEIDLALHRREVLLGAALQDEPRAQFG